MDKQEWFKNNGFNENGITYCIIGDTFKNKEYLKQKQCKYSPLLKWHCDNYISLPEYCSIVEVPFEKIYEWDKKLNKPLIYENAESWLQKVLNPNPQTYEFLGEINQRIFDLEVIYKSSYDFISRYGQFTYIHTFETNKNKIIWFTTKKITYSPNTKLLLTGTVVQHQNYKGDNTTIVNRCILK